MSVRIDVPALLRRAEVCVSAARASCECPSLNGRLCNTCAHAEDDERFLARLSDAVEAWQAARSRQSHDDILAVRRSELAMLALLRGEVAP